LFGLNHGSILLNWVSGCLFRVLRGQAANDSP